MGERREQVNSRPEKGDHVYAWRLKTSDGLPALYQHHGIYVGDNRVVAYSAEPGSLVEIMEGEVGYVSLDDFTRGEPVRVKLHEGSPYGREQVVERAEARLGECEYSLFTNNCEHFANECADGRARSPQLKWMLPTLAAGVLVVAATGNKVLRSGVARGAA